METAMAPASIPDTQYEEQKEAKALVLLSGGLDSSTALYWTHKNITESILAISFSYGQRHLKEVHHAAAICVELDIQHRILTGLEFPKSMLTDESVEVPNISYDGIEGISPTYVPFRNGSMLARAAAEAQAHDLDFIVWSPHAEDAAGWAYPDCTPEFAGSMANAIFIGTYMKVRLLTPFIHMMKYEIVKLGKTMDVPFEKTWSCYKGERLHCGTCPTCRSRQDSFKLARVTDHTLYKEDV